MLTLSEAYNKSVQEETTLTPEQLKTRHVGKQDPKRHLENAVEQAMSDQVGLQYYNYLPECSSNVSRIIYLWFGYRCRSGHVFAFRPLMCLFAKTIQSPCDICVHNPGIGCTKLGNDAFG